MQPLPSPLYAWLNARFSAWPRTLRYVLLYVAGAITSLAFAPFFAVYVTLCTIPLLLLAVRGARSVKQAGWYGWTMGLGYFTAGLYWVAHALLIEPDKFGWMIPFATLGMGAALALYIALASMAAYQFRHASTAVYGVAFAVVWTLAEIARATLFTGFPWNPLGASWAFHEVALQTASLGGVFYMSFSAMLAGAAILILCDAGKANRIVVCAIAVHMVALLGYGAWRLEQHPPVYEPNVVLRIVQPNIAQRLKWDAQQRLQAIDTHIMLSNQPADAPITHLVWSESAMTIPFASGDRWAQKLAESVPDGGALLTGVVRIDPPLNINSAPNMRKIYNSLQVMTRDAAIASIYDKRKLVPFGEYVPLRPWLPFVDKVTHGMRDFSVGDNAAAVIVPGAPDMRVLICYEAIFPWLSHGAWPHPLLNQTNDAWFGISTGPYQHFHLSRIRAVEQGVPLIRAANTGISGVVDAVGRVVATIPLGTQNILDVALPVATPTPTYYGRAPFAVLSVVLLLCSLWCVWMRRQAIR